VLPSTLISGLDGLASYNLNLACAYYLLITKAQQNDDKNQNKNKFSTNFGMLPNTKGT
jgi:hypothetical protein